MRELCCSVVGFDSTNVKSDCTPSPLESFEELSRMRADSRSEPNWWLADEGRGTVSKLRSAEFWINVLLD